MNHEEQERQLRSEAGAFLERYGIVPLLEEYGQPHLSGSYSLALMTWRDLDIYLEMEPVDVAPFLEMGGRLGRALRPRKLSYTDHLNFASTEAVTGLYWGIQSAPLSRGGWKLDIWGVSPAECAERLRHCDSIRARLDVDSRAAILEIKGHVCKLPQYRDTITSQHVYDAVLEHGARSLEDFRRFMKSRDS